MGVSQTSLIKNLKISMKLLWRCTTFDVNNASYSWHFYSKPFFQYSLVYFIIFTCIIREKLLKWIVSLIGVLQAIFPVFFIVLCDHYIHNVWETGEVNCVLDRYTSRLMAGVGRGGGKNGGTIDGFIFHCEKYTYEYYSTRDIWMRSFCGL